MQKDFRKALRAEILALREVKATAIRVLARRKSIETDIHSAHCGRGGGAADWMREDDRDFLADLKADFDALDAAIKATP